MTHPFCPGYEGPFRALAESYPDNSVYPPAAFRTEWGPIFHRGRLDGTARIIVIGQDPAAHESAARRILIGEAGQRVQGFLNKLGITDSYVMINAFLYSAYNQPAAAAHSDAALVSDRNAWLEALFAGGNVTAVVALGKRADQTYQRWTQHRGGVPAGLTYVKIFHPTADAHQGTSTASLLADWNNGLTALTGKVIADTPGPVGSYAGSFTPLDLGAIPARDLPAGVPAWMRALESWAVRPVPAGAPPVTPAEKAAVARYKRTHLLIEMPDAEVP